MVCGGEAQTKTFIKPSPRSSPPCESSPVGFGWSRSFAHTPRTCIKPPHEEEPHVTCNKCRKDITLPTAFQSLCQRPRWRRLRRASLRSREMNISISRFTSNYEVVALMMNILLKWIVMRILRCKMQVGTRPSSR